MSRMTLGEGIKAVEGAGALLVYPLANKTEPASLWSTFFPRSSMRWEWDSGADDRVARLWHLREELSRSGKVVYVKWFRHRATFFSRELFTAMLRLLVADGDGTRSLSREARQIYGILEETSPLSTKELKREAKLEGRLLEKQYEKALKELWQRLLVVGWGERDDGAFPSLLMGATRLLFEDLWRAASRLEPATARAIVEAKLAPGSPFRKQWDASLAETAALRPAPKILRGFTPLD